MSLLQHYSGELFSMVGAYSRIVRGVFFWNSEQEGFYILEDLTPSFHTLIREFLFADNIDFLLHTIDNMQHIVDLFAASSTASSLELSLMKTKVIFILITGGLYTETTIVRVWLVLKLLLISEIH